MSSNIPAPTNDSQPALLVAFNAHFGTAETDLAVVQRMLGVPGVREWYAQYRAEYAIESSLPDHWREAGLTAPEWAGVQVARRARTEARANAAKLLNQAAADYAARQKAIEASLNEILSRQTTPLIEVVEAGLDRLPLSARLAIERQTGDERTAAANQALSDHRRIWVAAFHARPTVSPFRGDAGGGGA